MSRYGHLDWFEVILAGSPFSLSIEPIWNHESGAITLMLQKPSELRRFLRQPIDELDHLFSRQRL